MTKSEHNPYGFSFYYVVSLFFAWGFLTAMNDILVPHFRSLFHLGYFQSMLVNFSFFGAYFVGSIVYFWWSVKYGDPINKAGYKKGIIAGLLLSAFGAFLFVPAAYSNQYILFLGALFTLGLGFTILQISANPYATILGPPETASSRLNLAQGFNSLGKTLAPILGGVLILGSINEAGSAGTSYVYFGFALLALSLVIAITPLPAYKQTEVKKSNKHAWQFHSLRLGALAIFFYVGAEVSIGSMLVSFLQLPETASMTAVEASRYVAIYLGGEMAGRFFGSIGLSKRSLMGKLVSYFNLLIIIFSTLSWAFGLQLAILCLGPVLLNMLLSLYGGKNPARLTFIYAVIAAVLLLSGCFGRGQIAVFSLVSIGLFNSIMWSNIFSLAIEKLGPLKSQGSSILVMAIIGGALFPLMQGYMADEYGVQRSYIVPVLAYIYIAWYALSINKLNNQA